jgi:hypothetical protein
MCWVCEGWVEAEFQLDLLDIIPNAVLPLPVEKGDTPTDFARCFLHFDFDHWQPDLMYDLGIKD